MKDGIYIDISIEEYHANKTHYSATGLKYAKKNLKNWWFYKQGYFEDDSSKSHFDFGNALELAIMDAVEFERKVAIMNEEAAIENILKERPDLKTVRASKEYKEWYNKFCIQNEGKYIIKTKGKESYEVIEHVLHECFANKVINKVIRGTEYQYSCFWTDEESGLKLKTRPDLVRLKNNIIIDIKSTIDGDPETWFRQAVKFDYPLQAVMQIDGCLKSGLINELKAYYWLVIEKDVPFSATLIQFDQGDIDRLMPQYQHLLKEIAEADKKEFYPSYGSRSLDKHGVCSLQIPGYYNIYPTYI